MQKFETMPVALKMKLLLLIMAVSMVGIFFLGHYYEKKFSLTLQEMYENELVPAGWLAEMQTNNANAEKLLVSMMLPETEKRSVMIQQIRELNESNERLFKAYQAKGEKDSLEADLIARYLYSKQLWQERQQQILARAEAGQLIKAREIYLQSMQICDENCEVLVQLAQNDRAQAEAIREAGQKSVKQAAQTVQGAAAVLIVLAVFLGWSVTRTVVRPLEKLVKEMAHNHNVMVYNQESSGTVEEISYICSSISALEERIERRTQELTDANQELLAMNDEMAAMNESLLTANQNLEQEAMLRRQKEQEALRRERQYRTATRLLTGTDMPFDELLKSILHDAVQIIGASYGFIGLQDEGNENFIIRHSIADVNSFHYAISWPVDQGMYSEVCQSGEMLHVEDYRQYNRRITDRRQERTRTVLMLPVKYGQEVRGALAVVWLDNIHQLQDEDIEALRQFADLASIALARMQVQEKVEYQNQLLRGLSFVTAELMGQLDLETTLQGILSQAISLLGVPHGFVLLVDEKSQTGHFKYGQGAFCSLAGQMVLEDIYQQGISGEICRSGSVIYIQDYLSWPQRRQGGIFDKMTMVLGAPLKTEGKVIGMLGVCTFGEKVSIEPEKITIMDQYGIVASLACKNAMDYQRIAHEALHDSLTGLPNRAHLKVRLDGEMERVNQAGGRGAVMFVDMDDLKSINDHYGHSYGDEAIIQVGRQLACQVAERAFVARVGGDEFIILWPEADKAELEKIADDIITSLNQELEVNEHKIHMSVSVGVTLYPDDGSTQEEVLKNADIAMYAAKGAGRNCWRFFEATMLKETYEKIVMLNNLRHALNRGELRINYQPQVVSQNGQVAGFEALLRWHSRQLGNISPAVFVPLAENSGLIQEIGKWVIAQACRFAKALGGLGKADWTVAINLSVKQLETDGLAAFMRRQLEEYQINPSQLEVEVTESILISGMDSCVAVLKELRQLGIGVSLDDFGTGYSSLTYLRSLPVSTIKLDKAFIDSIVREERQQMFVSTIIKLAHDLGLFVVAEGVETSQQRQLLNEAECDYIQGYLFSRPLEEEAALQMARAAGEIYLEAGSQEDSM